MAKPKEIIVGGGGPAADLVGRNAAGRQALPEITREQKDAINTALRKIAAKAEPKQKFINYYNGKHGINFASNRYKTTFAKRLETFSDNLCGVAVKTPADRLQITGFAKEKDKDFYNASWTIWKRSQMPRFAKETHRDAFKTGDAYVTVFHDADGKARIYTEDALNCAVWYDEDGSRVAWGAKLWRGDNASDYYYLTLYYPDRVEKYRSTKTHSEGTRPATAASFEIRPVVGRDGNPEPFPLPLPKSSYGVCPMFHFGRERSILADVIPLNDALNKTIADMLIASEANSFRQRWASGITFEVDPETGKQIVPYADDQKIISTDDPAARFGQFPDSTLGDFVEVMDYFSLAIARVTGIPAWYFKPDYGSFPSGDALERSEGRFVDVVQEAQLDFGETWAAVMRLAMRLDGIQPPADQGNEKEIETYWTPAAMSTQNQLVDLGIKKKSIGVSTRQVLSEIGYTDATIEQMATENADAAKAAAETFSKAFDSGSIDNPDPRDE
jgi:hypothetical protein